MYFKNVERSKNLGLNIYLFLCNVSVSVAIIRQNKSKSAVLKLGSAVSKSPRKKN